MPKCILFKSGVTVTTNGSVKPCCIYQSSETQTLTDNWSDYYTQKSAEMEHGWIPECVHCKIAEERGEESDRIDAINELRGTSYEFWDLKLNNTCNLSCRMCNPHSSSTMEQNVKNNPSEPWDSSFTQGIGRKTWFKDESVDAILDKIIHAKKVKFTGGEPFLIPQIETIIQHLINSGNSKDITLSFVTNGTVLFEKWVDKFKQFKKVIINISIDAIEDRFEYIRAGASWKQVSENIIYMRELELSNVEIRASILPSIFNYNNIQEVVDWCNSIDIEYYVSNEIFKPVFLSTQALTNPELKARFIQQMEIQDRIHGTNWQDFVSFDS